MASRSKDKTLQPLLADAAEKRLRKVDTSLFHRARKQIVSNNAGRSLPSPDKAELVAMLKRRMSGQTS